jgi:osmotically-inducible protein OsmY
MRQVLRVLGIISCVGVIAIAGEVRADPGLAEESHSREVQPYNRSVDHVLREIRRQVRDARYNIRVTDLDDAVLLEGEVDSENTRREMVRVTHAAASKPVRDELRVRPAPSDSQIAERVKGALRQDYPQLADRVQVEVRNGVAYLSGNLGSHREVDELLSTALMVEGVTDIKSDITLAGRPYATQRLKARKY